MPDPLDRLLGIPDEESDEMLYSERTPEEVREEGKQATLARRKAADVLFHSIEQELFEKNAVILDDMTYVFDLSPKELQVDMPPERWVRELGVVVAKRRFRIAKCAMLPTKDAPIVVAQAGKVVTNMMKAKGNAVGSDRKLPVTVIEVPQPSITRKVEDMEYEVVDVDPEED